MAKPEWLRIKARNTDEAMQVRAMLRRLSLHTVCQEAACPNLIECFGRKTATFMILGSKCTRNCSFCNVTKAEPEPLDHQEPEKVAQATSELGLKHLVITSVTRDDLSDGGAGHFASVIRAVQRACPDTVIEVLIPDFKGEESALLTIVEAGPHIINHNVETIPRLYPTVRPMAIYERSLELLKNVKQMDKDIHTKSGIMVGLGEEYDEVLCVMGDLVAVGCDLLTIGQYLAPSRDHHPVIEYIHPDLFEAYKRDGLRLGFKYIASGPLVRSSYHADRANETLMDSDNL
ncbi:MAG TPA: lipoyl synthase [Bacillota bacterium]|nr:lipoyl synthase [Bacillota bacterium]